ncbi:MAG: efflux RND transporter periplasmic adaptor subunit [Deferrisomatales bacterium]|nr:efflux RND transporter periplasmic adaptor subunit [Deferrisomatales bacterium]
MSDSKNDKKQLSRVKVAGISVVATLVAVGGLGYLTGYLGPHGPVHVHEDAVTGEKTLYTCGMHPWIIAEEPGTCPICGMNLTPKKEDAGGGAAATGERKILYWKAPMNPTEIYDAPGKSAMGMDLVPVYEDSVVGGVEVRVDPVTQQNMGVRVAVAEVGVLQRSLRTYGHVTYDETTQTQVSPKFSGWIEKLYVDFTGQFVKQGDPLFDIYSPELVSSQEEYLSTYRQLQRAKSPGSRDLLASSRQRLLYSDVPEDMIRAIEKSGAVRKFLTIRSPYTGVVTHKNAIEGTFVKEGQTIYQIADLRRVWVEAHIYEYELPWVKVGQAAIMTLPYLPGREFIGKVAYVYPYLQRKTRDVVIRLEFDNPGLELKPDMYADVAIESTLDGEGLIIPSEAVIRSGARNVVFVTRGDGKFSPRDVTLGQALDGGRIQILTGIAAGEQVVTSGQFLLDSESKLKEAVQKMLEARSPKAQEPKVEEDAFFKEM